MTNSNIFFKYLSSLELKSNSVMFKIPFNTLFKYINRQMENTSQIVIINHNEIKINPVSHFI